MCNVRRQLGSKRRFFLFSGLYYYLNFTVRPGYYLPLIAGQDSAHRPLEFNVLWRGSLLHREPRPQTVIALFESLSGGQQTAAAEVRWGRVVGSVFTPYAFGSVYLEPDLSFSQFNDWRLSKLAYEKEPRRWLEGEQLHLVNWSVLTNYPDSPLRQSAQGSAGDGKYQFYFKNESDQPVKVTRFPCLVTEKSIPINKTLQPGEEICLRVALTDLYGSGCPANGL